MDLGARWKRFCPSSAMAIWSTDADRGAAAGAPVHCMPIFLTPEGECFHNSTVTGGKPASEGPLALKRELRETEGRLATMEADSCARRRPRLQH